MNLVNPTDPSVKILVIEDHLPLRQKIMDNLVRSFPLAQTYALRNFIEDDVEKLIIENQYSIILLDGTLIRWEKETIPKFDTWGGNVIPVIKQHSPQTVIVAISDNPQTNQYLMKAGATIVREKANFLGKGRIDENLNHVLR